MIQLDSAALWVILAIYILASTLAVTYLPAVIAPVKDDLTNAEEIDALDIQNNIRQTVIQICGGVGFLFSIFAALSAQDSANRDLKARYDRETAELFVKTVESASPVSLYALIYVARRDRENYHDVIFRILASLIRSLSPVACGEPSEGRRGCEKELATQSFRNVLGEGSRLFLRCRTIKQFWT
jgi:hypothetical protein